jgi:hypothetical protein
LVTGTKIRAIIIYNHVKNMRLFSFGSLANLSARPLLLRCNVSETDSVRAANTLLSSQWLWALAAYSEVVGGIQKLV